MTLGNMTGTFDSSGHGLEGDGGIYVEAHFDAAPGCPQMNGPTPSRTLIIANVNASTGNTITYAQGLRVTLLDFDGVLTSAPFVSAFDATATAIDVQPGQHVTFSLSATFDGGALSGQFTAPHCTSLDAP